MYVYIIIRRTNFGMYIIKDGQTNRIEANVYVFNVYGIKI